MPHNGAIDLIPELQALVDQWLDYVRENEIEDPRCAAGVAVAARELQRVLDKDRNSNVSPHSEEQAREAGIRTRDTGAWRE